MFRPMIPYGVVLLVAPGYAHGERDRGITPLSPSPLFVICLPPLMRVTTTSANIMAGDAGEAGKLKLTLKDPGNASAQQWKDCMWSMLIDGTRADRGVQETIWRGIMAYIERLTAFQANHYATAAAGTPHVPPTLAVIQSWVLVCSCGTPAGCTCAGDDTSRETFSDFQEAME